MRKLVVFLFTLVIVSCTADDYESTYTELLPIENAIVTVEFERGEVYDIIVSYIRPSSCHAFNDMYFDGEENEWLVAVMATVFQGSYECDEIDALTEASFPFKAGEADSYIFKFWQGVDDDGDDQYLVIEVPVVD